MEVVTLSADDVRKAINHAITSGAKTEEPRLRLSQIGLCPRANVLSVLTGIVPDFEDMAGILFSGKIHETIIDQAFSGYILVQQKEVEVEGVKGHIDFYLPELNVIIECKTTNLYGLQKAPFDHHLMQVLAYMVGIELEVGSMPKAFIVYFAREDPKNFRVNEVYCGETAKEYVIQTIRQLKEAVEKEEVPPIPMGYRPEKFPCRWFSQVTGRLFECPFHERCWSEPIQQLPEADEIAELASKLAEIDEQVKKLSMEAETIRNIIKSAAEQNIIGEGKHRFGSVCLELKFYPEVEIPDTKRLVELASSHGISIPVIKRKGYWTVKVFKL